MQKLDLVGRMSQVKLQVFEPFIHGVYPLHAETGFGIASTRYPKTTKTEAFLDTH